MPVSHYIQPNEFTPKVCELLYKSADQAGMKAVLAATITPMVVSQHANPLDDNSPVERQWFVSDGPCGFAWVNVKPGTSRFAKWLVDKGYASKDSYYGGVTIWVHQFNQSMQKKETYAAAFASVLAEHGITAHSNSRMD